MTKIALGFDYGRIRIGVAVGQTLTASASALKPIDNSGAPALKLAIDKLMQQWQPTAIIVGWPTHTNGQPHELWPEIETFCLILHSMTRMPVHKVHEYLSSFEAQVLLRERKPSKHASVDSEAAKLILESWLRT